MKKLYLNYLQVNINKKMGAENEKAKNVNYLNNKLNKR